MMMMRIRKMMRKRRKIPIRKIPISDGAATCVGGLEVSLAVKADLEVLMGLGYRAARTQVQGTGYMV
jgi:hypothetical protein